MRGLTCCFLCKDCAADLLPLTLPPFFPLASLFSIQRGTSASLPKLSTVGSASRLGLNVAGAKTRYVKENHGFSALFHRVGQVRYDGGVLHNLMHSHVLIFTNQLISVSFARGADLLRSQKQKIPKLYRLNKVNREAVKT